MTTAGDRRGPPAQKPAARTSNIASDAIAFGRPRGGWRLKLYTIVFESDTRAGLLFDEVLLITIVASVIVVMLDSMRVLSSSYDAVLDALEWLFTGLFTIEYVARLLCVDRPWRYARSFFGIVDLASVLPSYLAVFVPELHTHIDVRLLRMLRIFRVLKLTEYFQEYQLLGAALRASARKIAVFLSAVVMIVVTIGTLMYVIEGPENGFTSIPVSVYWAITTMTTVGFGDIVPQTEPGRFVASLMMLMGWGVLAVPTGIVTAEMTSQRLRGITPRICPECRAMDHVSDARFCRVCGASLEG
jgi:voltage-gated potassium channel